MRAARSAWMDAGSSIASVGSASAIITASCSAKSGLPSAVEVIRVTEIRVLDAERLDELGSLVHRTSCSSSSLAGSAPARARLEQLRPRDAEQHERARRRTLRCTRRGRASSARPSGGPRSTTSSGRRSEPLEEPPHRPEHLGRWGAPASVALVTAAKAVEDDLCVGRSGEATVAALQPAEVGDELLQRPERDAASVREASAASRRPRRPRARADELPREPGLSDPGRAEDGDDVAALARRTRL